LKTTDTNTQSERLVRDNLPCVHTPKSKHKMSSPHRWRSWILYLLSFVLISLSAGLVYGWPALRQQLQDDGSLLSEKSLGGVFTTGAWSTQGGRFFVGVGRDRFGTRIVLCVCMVLVTLGCIALAESDPNNVTALSLALFSVGLGSGVQLCTQPVAGLFPNNVGVISSSLSGAFQISGLVFLVLTSGNASRQAAFLIFAGCLGMLTVLAGFMFPQGGSFLPVLSDSEELTENQMADDDETTLSPQKDIDISIRNEGCAVYNCTELSSDLATESMDQDCGEKVNHIDRDSTLSSKCEVISSTSDKGCEVSNGDCCITDSRASKNQSKEVCSNHDRDDISDSNNAIKDATPTALQPTSLQQMKSLEYILLCSWFSITLLPMQYYVATIGFQLEEAGDDDGFYTSLFAYTYAGSVLTSPLSGWIADRYGLGVAQGGATYLVAISLFLLAASNFSLNFHSVGLVAYGIGRLSIFGTYFTNIGKRLGYANYGTLAGFGLLISAIVSLLQYPLIGLSSDGYSAIVNISMGVVLVVQLPYFIWLYRMERHPLSLRG
jgi:LAT3 family solute carrier family 43 protein 3